MMRNFRLSDDLAFRFGDKNWAEYPLTTKKIYFLDCRIWSNRRNFQYISRL